ncbi:hypothetical protein PR001_g18282 [Phytophthora rubi]|uniref:Crinkler effector protein N-terminal domain-containing protein n=1 Tax=Phytophthora rubi TaxID=129364 RepID=A0A6A3K495_9STRA|nr:hypothetical protein PR001_g18282 [Phytophthora rubi]
MVQLFCAIVGVAGSAFPVDIDTGETMGDLKKAIKKEKKNMLKDIDADKLQLFLAKKDGAWLKDDDPAALELEEGKTHQDIQTVIDGEKWVLRSDSTSFAQRPTAEDMRSVAGQWQQVASGYVASATMMNSSQAGCRRGMALVGRGC